MAKPQDGVFRAHPFLGGGYDQEPVAEDPVVLDGGAEAVRLQGLELVVHAAALQSVVVQHLAELLGAVLLEDLGRAGVAPGLDALVAELAHRFQRAGHVAGEIAADRIKLQSDRDLLRLRGPLRPESPGKASIRPPAPWLPVEIVVGKCTSFPPFGFEEWVVL